MARPHRLKLWSRTQILVVQPALRISGPRNFFTKRISSSCAHWQEGYRPSTLVSTSFCIVIASMATPSALYASRNLSIYREYGSRELLRIVPPSIERLNFIHPGGLHGEEKRNNSGFSLRASRSTGRM